MTLGVTSEMRDIVNARFTILSDLRRNTKQLINATPEPARRHLEDLICDFGYMVDCDVESLLNDWLDAIREGYKAEGIDV